jgi:hypothetical protein
MKSTVMFAAATLAAQAMAQTGVVYRLAPTSTLTEIYCTGPCACPFYGVLSTLTGTFTLARTGEDPLFTYYSVTSVDWEPSTAATGHISGSGSFKIGGEVAITGQLTLNLDIGGQAWSFDSGIVVQDPQHPFPEISLSSQTPVVVCRQDVLTLLAVPVPCYPNCDGSAAPPAVNVGDFTCFLRRFADGDPYANCDGSSGPPALNVADFTCFLQMYAAGCP